MSSCEPSNRQRTPEVLEGKFPPRDCAMQETPRGDSLGRGLGQAAGACSLEQPSAGCSLLSWWVRGDTRAQGRAVAGLLPARCQSTGGPSVPHNRASLLGAVPAVSAGHSRHPQPTASPAAYLCTFPVTPCPDPSLHPCSRAPQSPWLGTEGAALPAHAQSMAPRS